MVATTHIFTTYHTLSTLLNSPQMLPYINDNRLKAMFTPLGDSEQKAMTDVFVSERNWVLYGLVLNPEISLQEGYSEEKQKSTRRGYSRNATLNLAYLIWEAAIQRAALSMEEISALYVEDKLESLGGIRRQVFEKQLALNESNKRNGNLMRSNVKGELIAESSLDLYDEYLNRFYDAHSYVMLANAQYQLMSAGVRADEVGEFLKNNLTLAYNPITRKPFAWDAQTRVLSTPWISTVLPPGARGGYVDDECVTPMPRNAVFIHLNN